MWFVATCLLALPSALPENENDASAKPFVIEVVDDATGRGVPLVELETVNDVKLLTDSNGLVAFSEPGFMDQTVFFTVRSQGYEFPKDGFGIRGKALEVTPGGSARIEIKRLNVAERLYRMTGEGIYRDTLLAGRHAPTKNPVLNGQVLGSDSVVNAIYKGKLRWFWGDTNRPGYPLGNFHVPGATSALPGDGGLDPNVGVDLSYYVDDNGFAKPTCKMPGDGPTWIGGLVVVPDSDGRERMYAGYVKVRNQLEVYQHGLVVWDDAQNQFVKLAEFPEGEPIYPTGHTTKRSVDGVEYVYFTTPYPLTRVRANVEHMKRPEHYEAYTPLRTGSDLKKPDIDRDADGRVRYAWKTHTPAVGPAEQMKLVKDGLLKPEESILALRDAETGKAILAHGGTVNWNEYRKRWVLVAIELYGTSLLGELWFAEADTPQGPWVYARKVVTHDKYSFYNPRQHPYFDQQGGRIIYFEGTYTRSFSGNENATPRYEYNQMMYRLDLADPRLDLPVAIYQPRQRNVLTAPFVTRNNQPQADFDRAPVWFALERPSEATVPVFMKPVAGKPFELQVGGAPPLDPQGKPAVPLFHAVRADAKEPPAATTALYEFVAQGAGETIYSTYEQAPKPGFVRTEKPVCRVWKNPITHVFDTMP